MIEGHYGLSLCNVQFPSGFLMAKFMSSTVRVLYVIVSPEVVMVPLAVKLERLL